jgi:hypothetical protein
MSWLRAIDEDACVHWRLDYMGGIDLVLSGTTDVCLMLR